MAERAHAPLLESSRASRRRFAAVRVRRCGLARGAGARHRAGRFGGARLGAAFGTGGRTMTAEVAPLPTRTVPWRMRASRPGLTLSAVNNPTPKEPVMDYKFEVAVVPVSDVGAAKSFYERIGYHTSSSPTSRRPVQSSTTPASTSETLRTPPRDASSTSATPMGTAGLSSSSRRPSDLRPHYSGGRRSALPQARRHPPRPD
jgi:hypothetical protein